MCPCVLVLRVSFDMSSHQHNNICSPPYTPTQHLPSLCSTTPERTLRPLSSIPLPVIAIPFKHTGAHTGALLWYKSREIVRVHNRAYHRNKKNLSYCSLKHCCSKLRLAGKTRLILILDPESTAPLIQIQPLLIALSLQAVILTSSASPYVKCFDGPRSSPR